MTKIRTMVVDDEPMARERIVGLLSQEKDIEMAGEYSAAGRQERRFLAASRQASIVAV